jgi:hypothetical protein
MNIPIGFDWNSLLKGSTIVDVGGGIGSTTMFLARAFNDLRVDSVGRHDGGGNYDLKPPAASTAHRHRARHPSDAPLPTSSELQGIHGSKHDMKFRFIVQDKPVVTSLGIAAWRSQCPEMLESGQVEFQGMSTCLRHDLLTDAPDFRQTMTSSNLNQPSGLLTYPHTPQSTFYASFFTIGRTFWRAVS